MEANEKGGSSCDNPPNEFENETDSVLNFIPYK